MKLSVINGWLFLLYLLKTNPIIMHKKILLLLLLPLFSISQTQSIIQEQSSHYKSYNFASDASWDSLLMIENNTTTRTLRTSAAPTASCNLTKQVYGWHPYWSGSVYTSYDWSMISEFCYFDYSVSPTTGNNTNTSFVWSTSPAVTAALSHSVNVHFCATMFSGHSTFWASTTAQNNFITNAISLLNSRGGKGINIDFEGMGSSDRVPFKNFMINLCNQVHAANPNYKVTMALYAVDWSSTFDMPALNAVVDNFIIMGYDYYYSGSAQAGPEAPLYNFQTTYNYTLSKSITYYLNLGATKSKLLLGLPWYGREWETVGATAPSSTTGGFTSSRTYSYVRNNPSIYSATAKKWEANSFNSYYSFLSGGANRQCFIDDAYSMRRKFDMVNQRGLGGIGIWALGYDDGYTDYWQAIKDKFSTCATVPCTDSIYDMGGPTRNYYDNENYAYTISPTGASKVRLSFSQFDLLGSGDTLFLYDGTSITAPIIGAYTGTTSPGIINSTGASLTVRFKSNASVVRPGFKAIWNCISDITSPTTLVNPIAGWITQDFSSSYTDIDNSGGVGIEKSYYQPTYFNGTEWRANGLRGFFNDDFSTSAISSDWTNATGVWSNVTGALNQTDEANSNTNLYATVTQSLSNAYLYNFKGTISGTGTNRRGGIHIFSDSPSLTNRGNSYLIWMRPDNGTIELYETISNVLYVVKTVTYTVLPNTVYDYKISYDKTSGEVKLWINDVFVSSWIDASPLTSATGVSFRSGNSKFIVDDFKVFRSRGTTSTILVGSATTNDLLKENVSPTTPSGKINSITNDLANNISLINSTLLDIDWTKPIKSTLIKDGTASDIDTTYIATQLDLNYTVAKDTNSGVTNYFYAIGTTAGAKDITNWTSNGLLTNATQTGLSLVMSQKYYIMVKCINGAGLMSDSTVSDGVLNLGLIGLEENNILNSLNVFPNPTNNHATISIIGTSNENVSYQLLNEQGKLIEKKDLIISAGLNTLEIKPLELNLSKGVYFIKLTSAKGTISKKLIIN